MSEEKSWFEMKDIRKRKFSSGVWIPLRVSHTILKEKTYGQIGYKEEFLGVGSVAFFLNSRKEADKLGWNSIGIGHDQGVYATSGYYKPAESYQHYDEVSIGVELVLVQRFDGEEQNEWHLNQDLVFALGLKREADEWLCPREGYTSVVRLKRDGSNNPISVEIKNDYLRDYLCARGMFLRISMYRKRDVVVSDASEVGSPEDQTIDNDSEKFLVRTTPILEGGHPLGASFAIFHVSRNDIDLEADVPSGGPETNENVDFTKRVGTHKGKTVYRVISDLWRNENIEPGSISPRIRGDKEATGIQYIVDASGVRKDSEDLNDEDIMQWLWFKPSVISSFFGSRGSNFSWYTKDTGGVGFNSHGLVHFGINGSGLVNVYAYDIAKLPIWQQRIWAGHNIIPEGGVSQELMAAHVHGRAADTSAPEQAFPEILDWLDSIFTRKTGSPLFRASASVNEILPLINRFRALEHNGTFTLAKDFMRIFADRVDVAPLQKVVPPTKGEKWGSIKTLEKYLASMIDPEKARKIVGPLAGIYDLRLADAHFPSSGLDNSYSLARVDKDAPPIRQGFLLIASAVGTLIDVGRVVENSLSASTQK